MYLKIKILRTRTHAIRTIWKRFVHAAQQSKKHGTENSSKMYFFFYTLYIKIASAMTWVILRQPGFDNFCEGLCWWC